MKKHVRLNNLIQKNMNRELIKSTLFLLLITVNGIAFAQNKPEEVNKKTNTSKWNMHPKDSVVLTKLWEDFLHSFEKGDVVFLQVNSAKKATISLNLE